MSYAKPGFRHPEAQKNELGYTRKAYEGAISTLCAGCGHDSISNAIVTAFFEMSIEPHRVVKLSGIGCSSKTPAYFLGRSHGFNSVHGRMPSVATGANMANRDLVYLGVSGDGDTASIGLGQFAHVVRRNLNMIYVVMNNGCYGLTKGQDSATADKGSKEQERATPVSLRVNRPLRDWPFSSAPTSSPGAFSGDKKQLVPMLKAAISPQGHWPLSMSYRPCVTFNNVTHLYQKLYLGSGNTWRPPPPSISSRCRPEIITDYRVRSRLDHTGYPARRFDYQRCTRREDKEIITSKKRRRYALTRNRIEESDRHILTGILYLEPREREIFTTSTRDH